MGPWCKVKFTDQRRTLNMYQLRWDTLAQKQHFIRISYKKLKSIAISPASIGFASFPLKFCSWWTLWIILIFAAEILQRPYLTVGPMIYQMPLNIGGIHMKGYMLPRPEYYKGVWNKNYSSLQDIFSAIQNIASDCFNEALRSPSSPLLCSGRFKSIDTLDGSCIPFQDQSQNLHRITSR